MKFGYFDDAAREYVITTPRTPYPWINYLGCEQFFGIISNTAGGYCFYRDARLRRITRYRYNNLPVDNGAAWKYRLRLFLGGVPVGLRREDKLRAEHRDTPGRVNGKAHPALVNIHDREFDFVPNLQGLPRFAAQNQHVGFPPPASKLSRRWRI